MHWLRLFHTLRYLKTKQWVFQIYYRVSGRLQWAPKPRSYEGHKLFIPDFSQKQEAECYPPTTYLGNATFCFLNQTKDFGSLKQINWAFSQNGKLWLYNLHYFEYLRQANMTLAEGNELITNWMSKTHEHRDAWEPYPSSLRIIHWLGFYFRHAREIPKDIAHTLYEQYRSLWHKLEYHLLGNHLLENAIALTFAAHFFDDEKRKTKALNLWLSQLKEQYASDGGHLERSPMYQSILLWHQLDLWNYLRQIPAKKSIGYEKLQHCQAFLYTHIAKQIGWLAAMSQCGGNYPHFNDSTAGIAPPAEAILRYAQKIGFSTQPTKLSSSGYRLLKTGKLALYLDLGPLGLAYQAGHGHADNLSFVLFSHGKPLLIDTGISTYEKNKRRAWERSTEAHNTVCVEGENSSDVWAAFRLGKRAETNIIQENEQQIIAEHMGYSRYGFRHRRTFTLLSDGLSIQDECLPIKASKKITATPQKKCAKLYFSPQLALEKNGRQFFLDWYILELDDQSRIRLNKCTVAKGFNQLENTLVLSVYFGKKCSLQIRKQ